MNKIGGYYFNKFPKKDIPKIDFIQDNDTINKNLFFSNLISNNIHIDNVYKFYNPFDSEWIKKYTLIDYNNVIISMPKKSIGILKISRKLEIIDCSEEYQNYIITDLKDPFKKYHETKNTDNDNDNINSRIIPSNLTSQYIYHDISSQGFFVSLLETLHPYNEYHHIQRKMVEGLILEKMENVFRKSGKNNFLDYLSKFPLGNIKYLIGKFFGANYDATRRKNSIKLMYDTGLLSKFYTMVYDPNINIIETIPQNILDTILSKAKNIQYQRKPSNMREELFKILSSLFAKIDTSSFVSAITKYFTDDEFILIANYISIHKLNKKIISLNKNDKYSLVKNFVVNVSKYCENMIVELEMHIDQLNILDNYLNDSKHNSPTRDIDAIKKYLINQAKVLLPGQFIKDFIFSIKNINKFISKKEFVIVLASFTANNLELTMGNNNDNKILADNLLFIQKYIDDNANDSIPNISFEETSAKLKNTIKNAKDLINKVSLTSTNFQQISQTNLIEKIVQKYCEPSCCLKYNEVVHKTQKKKEIKYDLYLCDKILDVLLNLKIIDINESEFISKNILRKNIDYVFKKNTVENYLSSKLDRINEEILDVNPTKYIVQFLLEIIRIVYNVIKANKSFDLDVGTGIISFYFSKLTENKPKYVSKATFLDTLHIVNIIPTGLMLNNINNVLPLFNPDNKYKLLEYERVQDVPDCVESSMRNLFNLILFDSDTNNLNIAKLPNGVVPELRNYYKKYHDLQFHYNYNEITNDSRLEWLKLFNSVVKKELIKEYKGNKKLIFNERSGSLCDIKSNYVSFIKTFLFLVGEKNNLDPLATTNDLHIQTYINSFENVLRNYFKKIDIIYENGVLYTKINNKYQLVVRQGHSYFETISDKDYNILDIWGIINPSTDKLISNIYLHLNVNDINEKSTNYFLLILLGHITILQSDVFWRYYKHNKQEFLKKIKLYSLEKKVAKYLSNLFDNPYWWYDSKKYNKLSRSEKFGISDKDKIKALEIIELALLVCPDKPSKYDKMFKFSKKVAIFEKNSHQKYLTQIISDLSLENLKKYIKKILCVNKKYIVEIYLMISDTQHYKESIDYLIKYHEKYNINKTFNLFEIIFRNNYPIVTKNVFESYYYLLDKIKDSDHILNNIINSDAYDIFLQSINKMQDIEPLQTLANQYITPTMINGVDKIMEKFGRVKNYDIPTIIPSGEYFFIPPVIFRILYILYGESYEFENLVTQYNASQSNILSQTSISLFFPEIKLLYPNIIQNISTYDEYNIDIVSKKILNNYYDLLKMLNIDVNREKKTNNYSDSDNSDNDSDSDDYYGDYGNYGNYSYDSDGGNIHSKYEHKYNKYMYKIALLKKK